MRDATRPPMSLRAWRRRANTFADASPVQIRIRRLNETQVRVIIPGEPTTITSERTIRDYRAVKQMFNIALRDDDERDWWDDKRQAKLQARWERFVNQAIAHRTLRQRFSAAIRRLIEFVRRPSRQHSPMRVAGLNAGGALFNV